MNLLNKKILKILLFLILSIIVFIFLIRPVYDLIKYKHKAVFDDYKHFLWLLNDSVKLDKSISSDPNMAVVGQIRESDQYFSYILEGKTYVHILEFKDLALVNLKNVHFSFDEEFSSFKKSKVLIMNEGLKRSPVITMKYKLPFNNKLRVNFTSNSELKVIKDTLNCKAFFGNLNKMSLSNEYNDHLVLFDFSIIPQVLITFYSFDSRFFIIFITSKKNIDESCINLLKLK